MSAANTGLILVQPVAIATDSLQTQQKATAYVRGAGGGPYDQGTNMEIKKGAEDLKVKRCLYQESNSRPLALIPC